MRSGVKVYDGFDGGEWGNLGAETAGRAGRSMFHADNVVRYRDGRLGPRAALAARPLTGLPTGTVWGMGFGGTPTAELWVVINAGVYLVNFGSGAVDLIGTLAVTPDARVQGSETQGSITHITVPDDKTYKIHHVNRTLTPYAGSPGGVAVALYGERLVVANRYGQTLSFSEATDDAVWPALNFLRIGNQAPLAAVFPQRNHLTVALTDGSWWVLTGSLGSPSMALRRVSGPGNHPWVFDATAGVVMGDERIAYVPINADFPALFNGAIPRELDHLGLAALTYGGNDDFGAVRAARGYRLDGAILCYANGFLLHQQDAWTFHHLPAGVTKFIASDIQGFIHMTNGGGPGVTPSFYTLRLDLDRPSADGDNGSAGHDAISGVINAFIDLPEFVASEGAEVRARSVVVDYRVHPTVPAEPSSFGVLVTARRQYDGGSTASPVQTETQAADSGDYRATFGFGDQGQGGSFTVGLRNLVGVSIRSVTVEYDLYDRRNG